MNNKKFIRYLNQNGGNAYSTTSNEIKIKHLDSLLLSESNSELPFTNSSLHNVLNYNDPNNDGGGIASTLTAVTKAKSMIKTAKGAATRMGSATVGSAILKPHQTLTATREVLTKAHTALNTTLKNTHDALQNTHNALNTTLQNTHNALNTTLQNTHNALNTPLQNMHGALNTPLQNMHGALNTPLQNTHNALNTTLQNMHGALNTTSQRKIKNVDILTETNRIINEANNHTVQLISSFVNLQKDDTFKKAIKENIHTEPIQGITHTESITKLLTFIHKQTDEFKTALAAQIKVAPQIQGGGRLILINNKSRKSHNSHKKNN